MDENLIHDKRVVNKIEIETVSKEIVSFNILEVEVGTTGLCGGDTGSGGRTYFALRDKGSTDIIARHIVDKYEATVGIEIELGGDSELKTLIEALKFATKELETKIEGSIPEEDFGVNIKEKIIAILQELNNNNEIPSKEQLNLNREDLGNILEIMLHDGLIFNVQVNRSGIGNLVQSILKSSAKITTNGIDYLEKNR